MAIVSEDGPEHHGCWLGDVYEIHVAASTERQLSTKAGPLLLAGVLRVGYARVAELRKGHHQGSVAHPRLSVRREDAARCEAVLTLLADCGGGMLTEDRSKPPMLVPATLLGSRIEMAEVAPADAYAGGRYKLGGRDPVCGGVPLKQLCLDDSAFAEHTMKAGAGVDFEEMKLKELKEELAARGSTRTALKAVLQRRLHGLLVEAAIEAQRAQFAEEGGGE